MKTALTDTIVFDNPNLAADRRNCAARRHEVVGVSVPTGRVIGGVPQEYYDGYRAGLTSGCADLVVTTRLENGEPAVLAIRRAKDKSFGGTWYMMGGAIHNYTSIHDFLSWVVEREVGLKNLQPEALVGLYRTTAEDYIADALAVCYVVTVPIEQIREQARPDENHVEWQLFTAEELDKIPQDQQYWHPMHCFRRCLNTMPK